MNPPHNPTEEQRKTVEAMCGYGIPEVDIARVLGIDPKTLRKHYRKELDTAFVHANARVAQSLFQQATSGNNVTAAIFWLKARAGWKDKIDIDVSTNERPIAELTDSELAAIIARRHSGRDGTASPQDGKTKPH